MSDQTATETTATAAPTPTTDPVTAKIADALEKVLDYVVSGMAVSDAIEHAVADLRAGN